jgi:ActR/RegA family two-component response regulator
MSLYRVLVVEDTPQWQSLLQHVSRKFDFADFDLRKTVQSARLALAARPVHIASLDQNLPRQLGEKDLAEYSFELLEEIVQTRPLIRSIMYTAFGRMNYAARAGRVGETEYFEKKQAEGQADAIDVTGYFEMLRALADGGRRPDGKQDEGYILWALKRARDHLPGMLGNAAGKLHDAQEDGLDSDKASKALASLIERTAELAWVHACALAAATGARLPNLTVPPRDLSEYLNSLGTVWQAVDDHGVLGDWRGYITESESSEQWGPTGGRF